MARIKSPEKRQALLESAIREIAEAGLGVSTAAIAKGAGLAEGTMFTYFASKHDLLNELYIELKTEMYRLLEVDFPHAAGLRERTKHVWTEYLRWAVDEPAKRRVSVLLNLSTVISAATREQMKAEAGAIADTMHELGRRGGFKNFPEGLASSVLIAMQEAVLEMAAKEPRQKAKLVGESFDLFWRMAK